MLLLQSSARPHGNTHQVAARLAAQLGAEHLDLLDFDIAPFNYEQVYPGNDDFLQLVQTHLLPRPRIILASPVYWYSMSGPLKIFFDRLSDLLMSHKELGRQLRGKRMSVLSVGNDAEWYPAFFAPFRLSAEYLGMEYGPEWHGWLTEGEVNILEL